MNRIIENLYEYYDLNEDTIFKEMSTDELATFICAYNDILLFNTNHYIDLWDYNSKNASLFNHKPYEAIKNVLSKHNINSYIELRNDHDAFDKILKTILN